ncbi:hypothetical protein HK104_003474 [Borealophlyctis nickersoniae]|nr:hypothetical protein HK104_003474 [Borealophlyctis nickersoniae]
MPKRGKKQAPPPHNPSAQGPQLIATTTAHLKTIETETLQTLDQTLESLDQTSTQIHSLLTMTAQILAACRTPVESVRSDVVASLASITSAGDKLAERAEREAERVEEREREVERELKVMALKHQELMNAWVGRSKGLGLVREGKKTKSNIKEPKKVKLDIGGTLFSVSLDTLLSQTEGFFTSLFSKEWQVKPGDDGTVFIDRDPTAYRYIFNYLREGGEEVVLPGDKFLLDAIKKEANFLCLEGLKTIVEEKLDEI